jgi:peptidylprolyl isomerase
MTALPAAQPRAGALAAGARPAARAAAHPSPRAASAARDDASAPPPAVSRRAVEALLVAAAAAALLPAPPATALGFKKDPKRRKIPEAEFAELPGSGGLRVFELEAGRGAEASLGKNVSVHFDCYFRGVDAVSTRSARTLGGNRVVAEPFEFVAGQKVAAKKVTMGDTAGGLFEGGSGPKPPPALADAVVGMRVGGRRAVLVPPERGYGDAGEQEIPGGATFEMRVELLEVK